MLTKTDILNERIKDLGIDMRATEHIFNEELRVVEERKNRLELNDIMKKLNGSMINDYKREQKKKKGKKRKKKSKAKRTWMARAKLVLKEPNPNKTPRLQAFTYNLMAFTVGGYFIVLFCIALKAIAG